MSATPLLKTPLHALHLELGAKMGMQRARTPDLTQPRPAAGFTTTGVPTTPSEPRGPWG